MLITLLTFEMVFYRRFNGQRSAKKRTIRVFHSKLLKIFKFLRDKTLNIEVTIKTLTKLKHNSTLNA